MAGKIASVCNRRGCHGNWSKCRGVDATNCRTSLVQVVCCITLAGAMFCNSLVARRAHFRRHSVCRYGKGILTERPAMRASICPCIFCELIHGGGEVSICYEDSQALAFLDIQPVNAGHVLVVPRQHYESLADLPADLARHLFDVALRLAPIVRRLAGADGLNVIVNSGASAGQDVLPLPRARDPAPGRRRLPGAVAVPGSSPPGSDAARRDGGPDHRRAARSGPRDIGRCLTILVPFQCGRAARGRGCANARWNGTRQAVSTSVLRDGCLTRNRKAGAGCGRLPIRWRLMDVWRRTSPGTDPRRASRPRPRRHRSTLQSQRETPRPGPPARGGVFPFPAR